MPSFKQNTAAGTRSLFKAFDTNQSINEPVSKSLLYEENDNIEIGRHHRQPAIKFKTLLYDVIDMNIALSIFRFSTISSQNQGGPRLFDATGLKQP